MTKANTEDGKDQSECSVFEVFHNGSLIVETCILKGLDLQDTGFLFR